MSRLAFMLAVCASVSVSASAFAGEGRSEETRSQTYIFNSSDLLTETGLNDVRKDIWSATFQVCRLHGQSLASQRRELRACRNQSYDNAMEQLDVIIADTRRSQSQFAQLEPRSVTLTQSTQ